MSNVVGFPTFWQTLQLPSSGFTCSGSFRNPCSRVCDKWDVKDLNSRTEDQVAVQSVASTWLGKGDGKRF
jgi:hypothetical protein